MLVIIKQVVKQLLSVQAIGHQDFKQSVVTSINNPVGPLLSSLFSHLAPLQGITPKAPCKSSSFLFGTQIHGRHVHCHRFRENNYDKEVSSTYEDNKHAKTSSEEEDTEDAGSQQIRNVSCFGSNAGRVCEESLLS